MTEAAAMRGGGVGVIDAYAASLVCFVAVCVGSRFKAQCRDLRGLVPGAMLALGRATAVVRPSGLDRK